MITPRQISQCSDHLFEMSQQLHAAATSVYQLSALLHQVVLQAESAADDAEHQNKLTGPASNTNHQLHPLFRNIFPTAPHS